LPTPPKTALEGALCASQPDQRDICFRVVVDGAVTGLVDLGRVEELKRREDLRFVTARRRSSELVQRGRRSMPSGVPMGWMASLWDHP